MADKEKKETEKENAAPVAENLLEVREGRLQQHP
jgi:hypothetical protein